MRRPAATLVATALVATALAGCAADPTLTVVALEVHGCRPHPELGTGVVVAVAGVDAPLVLTAAHVVAGARTIEVTYDGAIRSGAVVAFDPDMDVAYLTVAGLADADAVTIGDGASATGDGTAHVVRDGRPVVVPVTVERAVRLRPQDVYVEGETRPPGVERTPEIAEGDSGGPVLVDGRLVGIVWARSRRSDARAYAIDPVAAGELTRAQLASGDLTGVDPTRCP